MILGWQLLLVCAVMLATSTFGAWMLRRAWQDSTAANRWRSGGWALLIAPLLGGLLADGARGLFIALSLASVAAIGVVASGAKIRPARAARAARESLAPEPADRKLSGWQRTLRWLLAGPIGLIAAMALGIAWSVWVPGAPQTRLAIGGLLVPVLWGAAMAWTLADDRILRAAAVLAGTAIAGFALAIFKGFA